MDQYDIACFVGIIGFIAAIFAAISAFQWISALIARTWPTVPGVVTGSWVDERMHARSGKGYAARVVYEYQVNGETLRSDRLYFGSNGPSSTGVDANILTELTVAKYSEGKQVTVHYNPANPKKAVVATRGSFLYPAIVLILAVIGAGLQFGFLDKIPVLGRLLQ